MNRSAPIVAIGTLCLMATACSVTAPVAVIGQRGDILTGSATATLSGGTYSVTNGALACGGSFDPGPGVTVNFTTQCSDGRHGAGIAARDPSGISGRGTVRLDDGETADFVFGKEATGLSPKRRAP